MLSEAQQNEIINKVYEVVENGNEILITDLGTPVVLFNKRGTCGATAYYPNLELNFNSALAADNLEEYLNQVIPHEVAHLFKSHVYGPGRGRMFAAHGGYWQQIMRALGANPTRTHNMDTSKVAQPKTKHMYECAGCKKDIVIGPVRHKNMVRGIRTYSHCRGQKLVFKETIGKVTNRQAHDMKVPDFIKKAAIEAKKPKIKSTKIAHAMLVYTEMFKSEFPVSRKNVISALMHSMQISEHQAAGYYQQCKKRLA